MTCVYCGGQRFERRSVDLPIYRDGKIVGIVRDIEVDVCVQCGEFYLDEDVIERMEKEKERLISRATTVAP
ncbi:YgiT-type zinc finger domain-containing protein [Candidatus Fervidibacteria bacterium JGI MDM2 SSWTFF-3-K9]